MIELTLIAGGGVRTDNSLAALGLELGQQSSCTSC
jgi:hypothetical protein